MVFLDATNKDSVKFIREFTYPSAVTHNAWTTDDRSILVTTDEGGTNHAILWDITNMSNQIRLSEIIPYDSASMVHNAYIKGDSLYLSHYRAGVIVYDISNPSLPVEVGHYDTYPGTNSTAYQGCWNVYPFLPSGNIIASDISTGLYVLKVGQTTSINHNNTEIIDNYNLSQNYPNPFNPATKINWQSPVNSWQTLKVYDVLGNEVVTLINEQQNAGTYQVDFDGSNLPSGVYFYKLEAGEFVETKRMILLK